MTKELVYQDDKSNKFWKIETNGKNFSITFGKIGTAGQTQTKEFDSEKECSKEAEKIIKEKLKNGYVEYIKNQTENYLELKKSKEMNESLIRTAKNMIKQYPYKNELKQIDKELINTDGDRGTYFNGFKTIFIEEELNAKILSECFQYYISFEITAIEDEKAIPLGSTKLKGLPHLPPSIKWPENYYFYAQINLSELSKFDIDKLFPQEGMLYIFYDCNDYGGCKIMHYNGKEELIITPYPADLNLPNQEYYFKEFIEETSDVKFNTYLIFYIEGWNIQNEDIISFIPDLKEKLEKLLNCEFSTTEDSGNSIYGKPMYYQEEEFDNEDEDDFADEESTKPIDKILIMQDDFGDGTIHFWIDKKDLKKRDFSKCFVTYSGT